MILYPAIDLKDGKCVRLVQGDMNLSTVFNTSPGDQAKLFEDVGFSWLHVVDLDGAIAGKPVNLSAVADILANIKIPVQLGGGIRDMNTISKWLDTGVERAILGTAALNNPQLVRDACKRYPGRIAVGIDARDGYVAVEGWTNTSRVKALALGMQLEDAGAAAIIYTDIQRDGTMKGVNLEATIDLAFALATPVIASGGVSSLQDLKDLKEKAHAGIAGVICGRALYNGHLDAREALDLLSAC